MKNTLETRLGIFFALALVVAVIILEMIGAADFFKGGYEIHASFKNAQELKRGDLVKMAGVEVGRVDEIELEKGRARVTMKIKGKYEIKTDTKAIIKFTGLMGNNFVTLEGGSDAAAKVLPGSALESTEQPDLSALMSRIDSVASGIEGLTKSFSADNFSTLFGPITDFMKQNSTNINDILSNTRTVTANFAQGKGTIGKLINDDALYTSALGAVSSLKTAGDQANSLMEKAQGVIGDAHEAITRFNAGQGTLGKLVNDESFYKNAKLTLQKLDKATEGLEDQGPLTVLGIIVNNLL